MGKKEKGNTKKKSNQKSTSGGNWTNDGDNGEPGHKRMCELYNRHHLYQLSVQSPKNDVLFCNKAFIIYRRRKPYTFREDFSGTGLLGCEWVLNDVTRSSVCIDLDEETLNWGKNTILPTIASASSRVQYIKANVLQLTSVEQSEESQKDKKLVYVEPMDIICSFNYSICILKQRKDLIQYFKGVYQGLVQDGMFICDLFGGYDSTMVQQQHRDYDNFRYSWVQERYDPMTNEILCSISWTFPDRSYLKRAFIYDWRLWSIAEVKECLKEVGFNTIKFWYRDESKRPNSTANNNSNDNTQNNNNKKSKSKKEKKQNNEDNDDNEENEGNNEDEEEEEEEEEEEMDKNKRKYLEKKLKKGKLFKKNNNNGTGESTESTPTPTPAIDIMKLLDLHIGEDPKNDNQDDISEFKEAESFQQSASWNVYIVALK